MAELKPCPICGGQASMGKYNTYVASFTKKDKFYGRCDNNGRHSQQETPAGFLTVEEAINAWNERCTT